MAMCHFLIGTTKDTMKKCRWSSPVTQNTAPNATLASHCWFGFEMPLDQGWTV